MRHLVPCFACHPRCSSCEHPLRCSVPPASPSANSGQKGEPKAYVTTLQKKLRGEILFFKLDWQALAGQTPWQSPAFLEMTHQRGEQEAGCF